MTARPSGGRARAPRRAARRPCGRPMQEAQELTQAPGREAAHRPVPGQPSSSSSERDRRSGTHGVGPQPASRTTAVRLSPSPAPAGGRAASAHPRRSISRNSPGHQWETLVPTSASYTGASGCRSLDSRASPRAPGKQQLRHCSWTKGTFDTAIGPAAPFAHRHQVIDRRE
jgi:hypothetical protein